MFSNLVDRVDSECVFFHDLLDLLELTSGEDRGAINAGVSVLEEYGRGVETFKVPRAPQKEPAVGGGREGEEMAGFEAGTRFSWVIRRKERSRTEDDAAWVFSVANAAAERAAELLSNGSGSTSSIGDGGGRGGGGGGGEGAAGGSRAVGAGLDSSIDFEKVDHVGGYVINGIMDDWAQEVARIEGKGGDDEGWKPRAFKLQESIEEARRLRKEKDARIAK